MHCLRWWLPVFLLPLPAASPFLLILFVVSYALRTKPCVYCSVIILGLMFSSCSFYHLSPLNSNVETLQRSTSSSTTSDEVSHVSLQSTVTPSSIPPVSEDIVSDPSKEQTWKSIATLTGPSSCWIDLSSHGYVQTSKMDLGRWSAPTRRRHRSVFSQAKFNSNLEDPPESQSRWQKLLRDGIFVGYEDVGFRLKFGLE